MLALRSRLSLLQDDLTRAASPSVAVLLSAEGAARALLVGPNFRREKSFANVAGPEDEGLLDFDLLGVTFEAPRPDTPMAEFDQFPSGLEIQTALANQKSGTGPPGRTSLLRVPALGLDLGLRHVGSQVVLGVSSPEGIPVSLAYLGPEGGRWVESVGRWGEVIELSLGEARTMRSLFRNSSTWQVSVGRDGVAILVEEIPVP